MRGAIRDELTDVSACRVKDAPTANAPVESTTYARPISSECSETKNALFAKLSGMESTLWVKERLQRRTAIGPEGDEMVHRTETGQGQVPTPMKVTTTKMID
jgi:hypothetical protein